MPSMLGFQLSKFVKEDFKTILKHFWGKIFGISILVGFLLFLLNIFLGVGFYAHNFSTEMKGKLGMYFYIKEDVGQKDALTKEVIIMKDELQSQGLKVTYSTKDDALSFLQKKIPDVVANFKKFGIDNPLPATLYIMFSTDAQYEAMKATILKHKAIILNIQDIDSGTTIKQQENRILTTINFSNLVVIVSYCIIAFILITVFAFLRFLLRTLFWSLHKEFEVKKLLWASHLDVTKSFVMVTLDIILFAFFVCLVLCVLSGLVLNSYLTGLFELSVWSALANRVILLLVFILEVIVVGGISVAFAYFFTNKLDKQLHIMK